MRKYEQRVKRGMELLDKVYTRRWLRWIDLDRLSMKNGDFYTRGRCRACVGAQIDARRSKAEFGNFYHFENMIYENSDLSPGDLGLVLDCGTWSMDPRDRRILSARWGALTAEWKRQIREARGEEVTA